MSMHAAARARRPVFEIACFVICLAALGSFGPTAGSPADASTAVGGGSHGAVDGSSLEERRARVEMLERAVQLEPGRAEWWEQLAQACFDARQTTRARKCLEQLAALAPDRAEPHLRLGRLWKQHWIAAPESSSFASAESCFAAAIAMDPELADAHVELATLKLLRGRPRRAAELAGRACALDSTRGDAILAFGCAMFRMGALARAASAFDEARKLLSPAMAQRFNDETWFVAGALEGGSEIDHVDPALVRKYWGANDPDLTTAENEAHLDFLSRLALALLVYRDGERVRWDERTELFVRYGPPAEIAVNPLDMPLFGFRYPRRTEVRYAPPPNPFPYDRQVWSYPELGLTVDLWDFSLAGHYRPATELEGPPPALNPAVIASRTDLVSFQGGRGVFRAVAPGTRPIALQSQVARFPSGAGARLLVHVASPVVEDRELVASCAVLDGNGAIVSRESHAMSLSACRPGDARAGEFSVIVPAGEYRVDVSVADGRGGRGVQRRGATVEADTSQLGMSDLVLLCGRAPSTPGSNSIRLEPDLDRRIGGTRLLSTYFEISRLRAGADGLSRFEYKCVVRRTRPGRSSRREEVRGIDASREESFPGTLRRQFVDVSIASLPPGAYELEIQVRDLVAHTQVRRSVDFARE